MSNKNPTTESHVLTEPHPRLEWVDYAKGIGIILVVYGHVLRGIKDAAMGIFPEFFYYSDNIVYSFHMPLFFFLSGMFVNKSLSKGKGFIGDKIKTIVYPYFLWSLISGGVQVLMSNYTTKGRQIEDLFVILHQPLGEYWFLYVLFLCYLLYAFLARFFSVYLIFSAAVAAYFLVPYVEPWVLNVIKLLLKNFVFFVLGALFVSLASWEKSPKPSAWAVLAIIVVFFLLQAASFPAHIENFLTVELLLAVFGIFMVITASMALAQGRGVPVLRYIGSLSLPIYVSHVLAASGIRIVLSKFLHYNDVTVHAILGMTLGLLFPIFLVYLTRKINFPYLFVLKGKPATV